MHYTKQSPDSCARLVFRRALYSLLVAHALALMTHRCVLGSGAKKRQKMWCAIILQAAKRSANRRAEE